MSIPTTCYTFLNGISDLSGIEKSPYVRNHDAGFPSVVFTFAGDTFPSSTTENVGPRLVRWTASVLSRTIEEAEIKGEAIVSAAQDTQSQCGPNRVVGVTREYEPAYDSARQGIYIHTTEMEFFV
tara:strand:- start:2525 stop:2899 length:375 start_codon:yes stop_codon:yes gene_type:complete